MKYDRALAVSSAMAILGGNIAWNLGLDALLESGFDSAELNRAVDIYSKVFTDLINGVMLEESMSASNNSDELDYLLMTAMKTSSLISNSLKMGAVLGGGTESQIKHLDEYGVLAGQAFQIRDDVLGTFGKKRNTGKSADADIRWGKKTLLAITAFKRATPKQKAVLKRVFGNRKASIEDVAKVKGVFMDSGALEYCNTKSQELVNKAHGLLQTANPALDTKTLRILEWLSDYTINRQK
jgi:geranylgeranyl diphosphate synthase type I